MGVSLIGGTPKTAQNDNFLVGKPMVVGETHHFSLHRLETLGGGEGARDAFQRTTFQLWKSLPTFEGRDVFFHMSYMKMVGNTPFFLFIQIIVPNFFSRRW